MGAGADDADDVMGVVGVAVVAGLGSGMKDLLSDVGYAISPLASILLFYY